MTNERVPAPYGGLVLVNKAGLKRRLDIATCFGCGRGVYVGYEPFRMKQDGRLRVWHEDCWIVKELPFERIA